MRQSEEGLDAGSILARMKENLFGDLNASDKRLSATLGVPRGTLVSWRNRNSIPLDPLMKLAKRFGWPIEWLMSGSFGNSDTLFNADIGIRRGIMELALFEVFKKDAKSDNPIESTSYWRLAVEITITYQYFLKLVRETAERLNVSTEIVVATLKADRNMSDED